MLPVGLNMSLVVGFWVLHINTALLNFCPVKVTAAISCLTSWYPCARQTQRTWNDTKMSIRDARLMCDSTLLMCKGVNPTIQVAAAAAGELIRWTPQQLCLPPLSSPTGIPTMSAVTTALEKANKAFNMLLKENRGEGERAGEVSHGEKRRQRWRKDSSRRRDGRKKKRARATVAVGVAVWWKRWMMVDRYEWVDKGKREKQNENKKRNTKLVLQLTIIFYYSWTWQLISSLIH